MLIGVSCGMLWMLGRERTKKMDDSEDINWPLVLVRIIVWSNVIALVFFYLGHAIYVLGKGNMYAIFGFFYLIVSSFG